MIEPLKNSSSNISFGRKVPVERCSIEDKKHHKISAIMCEYDCKDSEDLVDFNNRCANLSSKSDFLSNMERNLKSKIKTNEHFYVLEAANGDIVALCHTKRQNGVEEIIDINSDKHYQTSNKNLLSLIGKQAAYNNETRRIKLKPFENNIDFYTQECGFKFDSKNNLYLDKRGMEKLYRECGGRNFNSKIDVLC